MYYKLSVYCFFNSICVHFFHLILPSTWKYGSVNKTRSVNYENECLSFFPSVIFDFDLVDRKNVKGAVFGNTQRESLTYGVLKGWCDHVSSVELGTITLLVNLHSQNWSYKVRLGNFGNGEKISVIFGKTAQRRRRHFRNHVTRVVFFH